MLSRLQLIILPAALALLLPEAFAQSTPAELREEGTAISVPTPRLGYFSRRKYELPDLAGATPATGSQLIDGRLPLPLIDYRCDVAGLRQRLTLFEGGLVSLEMEGAGATIRKKIRIPEDALRNLRESIRADDLMGAADYSSSSRINESRAFIRIYDDTGQHVERNFHPNMVLPEKIEKQRRILLDLLRALAEEREISNPVTGYIPQVGDRLIGDDSKIYKITQMISSGSVAELTCLTEPTKMYVASKDLYNYFIAVRREAEAH